MNIGERLWNGAIVTPYLAEAYNALQARMDQFRAEGRPVPLYLLNGAHNLVASAIGPEPRPLTALRRLRLHSKTLGEIYDMRQTIGSLLAHLPPRHELTVDDARYVDSIRIRLREVTRP